MKDLLGVYGAAGCGRGIMPVLRAQYPNAELVFVDDGKAPAQVNGHKVIQGIKIGAGAIIGMGAVVTRDVPAGAVVVGNPAKPLIKE